jgi:DNA-binding CsgD family transcriptional regulator
LANSGDRSRARRDVREKGQSRISPGETGQSEPFAAITQRLQALLTDDNVLSSLADEAAGVPTQQSLTPRERDIVRGLVCYRRVSAVADVLGISVHTARNHLKSILRKLNLHSQDQLLRLLLEGRERR